MKGSFDFKSHKISKAIVASVLFAVATAGNAENYERVVIAEDFTNNASQAEKFYHEVALNKGNIPVKIATENGTYLDMSNVMHNHIMNIATEKERIRMLTIQKCHECSRIREESGTLMAEEVARQKQLELEEQRKAEEEAKRLEEERIRAEEAERIRREEQRRIEEERRKAEAEQQVPVVEETVQEVPTESKAEEPTEETETNQEETQQTEAVTEPVTEETTTAPQYVGIEKGIHSSSKSWFKAYMSYKAVTNKRSQQYKLLNSDLASTDPKTGIRMYDGRYCVAVGSYYTTTIGQKMDIYLDTGVVIPCVLGDAKADRHTNSTNQYCLSNGSVAEFIVDYSIFNSMKDRSGTVNWCVGDCGSFAGNITKIVILTE